MQKKKNTKQKSIAKTRRPSGAGCIFKRADKRWSGYVSLGKDENGKLIRKTVYGKTREEVVYKLYRIKGGLSENLKSEINELSIGYLMEQWLLTFKRFSTSPITFWGNYRSFQNHIQPNIGSLKINEVSKIHVQEILNNLALKNYSSKTINKIKQLISAFFDFCVDECILNKNPIGKIRIKDTYDCNKYKALTKEERMKLIEAFNTDIYYLYIRPLAYVMLFAGLRKGEAFALKWKNIDFENNEISVLASVKDEPKIDKNGKYLGRFWAVGDTKTYYGRRIVPMIDFLKEELLRWYEWQKSKNKKYAERDTFLFSDNDLSFKHFNSSKATFQKFLKRHNIRQFSWHSLRHTFATMLMETGINPKIVQGLMGHSNVKTTLMIYNNINDDYVKSAIINFNNRINENFDLSIIRNKRIKEDKPKEESRIFKNYSDEEIEMLFKSILEEKYKRQN